MSETAAIQATEIQTEASKATETAVATPRARSTAKLFMTGRSQAVRLPAEFRFEGKEVYIRRNPETGDVILSRKPSKWDEIFAALDAAEIPDDFLTPEDRNQGPPQVRDCL